MNRVRKSLLAIALSISGLGIVSSGVFFIVQADNDKIRPSSKRASGTESQPVTESKTQSKAAPSGIVTPLINEIDADQTSTDMAEFVEISAPAATSLNGFVLVFYNGATDVTYRAIDLDGLVADANGLVLIGNPGVPGVDATFPNDTLQNGQDAVALYTGDATSFPNGTAVTVTGLIDALVYDTADADDPGLLTLMQPGFSRLQIDETGLTNPTANGIQRCSHDARDGRVFAVNPPSPNAVNTNCPNWQDAPVDFDGDGATDYVVIRDPSLAAVASESAYGQSESAYSQKVRLGTRDLRSVRRQRSLEMRKSNEEGLLTGTQNFQWWVMSSATGGTVGATWGETFDQIVSADFDGDGRDDYAVWKSDADPELTGFHWVNSSNFTAEFDSFGLPLDDPTVIGDYDGDGKDDRAVFRCPDGDPGTCHFFYRSSANPGPVVNYLPWGNGAVGEFLPCSADYDGDGVMDICINRQDPDFPDNQQFVYRRSVDGQAVFVTWGLFFDLIVPGDYDGDGKADFGVLRDVNGLFYHYILTQTGAVTTVQWGYDGGPNPFPDISVPGDYDGDHKTDIAIWRPTDSTKSGLFWVLKSTGGYTVQPWGLSSDVPLASVQVGGL